MLGKVPGVVAPALAEDPLKIFAEDNLLLQQLLGKLLETAYVGRDNLLSLPVRLLNDLLNEAGARLAYQIIYQ